MITCENEAAYRAVLFDLDGTLLYTLEDIGNAMNRALIKNGLPTFKLDEYRYLVGNGAAKLAQRAVREHTELAEKVHCDYQAYYEMHSMQLTRPYDGIPEMLHALKKAGFELCVLSNKPDADTRRIIINYFGDQLFNHVQGQKEGTPVKPDPGAALQIARELQLPPNCFAYLGDSAVDMECAVRAGMTPIGAAWGYRTEEELQRSGAKYLLRRPLELLEVLK